MRRKRRSRYIGIKSLIVSSLEILFSPFVLLRDCFSRRPRLNNKWLLRFFGLLIFSTALSYISSKTLENSRLVWLKQEWPGCYQVANIPYADLINYWASKTSLDPRLIAAVIKVESSGRQNAVSSRGARGLMQIMPSTWDEVVSKYSMDVSSSFDPSSNIAVGSRYLREMVDRCDGKVGLALIAYNGGLGAIDTSVKEIKAGALSSESSRYVAKVYSEWDRLRNPGDPRLGALKTGSGRIRGIPILVLSLYGVMGVWIGVKLVRKL